MSLIKLESILFEHRTGLSSLLCANWRQIHILPPREAILVIGGRLAVAHEDHFVDSFGYPFDSVFEHLKICNLQQLIDLFFVTQNKICTFRFKLIAGSFLYERLFLHQKSLSNYL